MRRDPFILLDDARQGAAAAPARLYTAPSRIFVARTSSEVEPALSAARDAVRIGSHIAGRLSYEAGLALEPRLAPLLAGRSFDEPLVWLAAFDGFTAIDTEAVPDWLAENADDSDGPPALSPMRPGIDSETYAARFAELREAIASGDIYQANLTFSLRGRRHGDPLALYAAIRAQARAGYGGVIWDGERWTLSFSPEMFFALHGQVVTLRPMKGTRPRGTDDADDASLRAELQASPKDRAENLMITDLMRNDVSRVAVAGSVRVENPFAIESYPTVHQMVTTVRARLAPDCDAFDCLHALFPCGSITGAPKIRAMELIDKVEDNRRETYCGAVGRVDPNGDAAFNVAIRTLRCEGGESGSVSLGVGSAIVADSETGDEWGECLIKGKFVSGTTTAFQLIETMAFDPSIGVPLIELHLERLKKSAAELGFECDRHSLRNDIQAFCFLNREPRRLRIVLSPDGTWQLQDDEIPAAPDEAMPVKLVALPVPEGDWRLRHKTTERAFYEAAKREAENDGAKEAALVRDDGFITEGTFTNVFVERDGLLLTPPASRGLLPGVLRRKLIEEKRAREADLTAKDLEGGFLLGNSVRGLMRARLL